MAGAFDGLSTPTALDQELPRKLVETVRSLQGAEVSTSFRQYSPAHSRVTHRVIPVRLRPRRHEPTAALAGSPPGEALRASDVSGERPIPLRAATSPDRLPGSSRGHSGDSFEGLRGHIGDIAGTYRGASNWHGSGLLILRNIHAGL